MYAFPLQQQPLVQCRGRSWRQAHHAARVDDPVPWHGGTGRERMQRVTHLARSSGQSGELGHLAVGRDLAARYPSHNGMDPLME
jgi:hypothetical protein